MFQLLYPLVYAIQPFLVPLCFFLAWAFVLLTVWGLASTIVTTVKKAREMHRIPCADCDFFTGDYTLKCTIHPSTALSEDAINCPDYDPAVNP